MTDTQVEIKDSFGNIIIVHAESHQKDLIKNIPGVVWVVEREPGRYTVTLNARYSKSKIKSQITEAFYDRTT